MDDCVLGVLVKTRKPQLFNLQGLQPCPINQAFNDPSMLVIDDTTRMVFYKDANVTCPTRLVGSRPYPPDHPPFTFYRVHCTSFNFFYRFAHLSIHPSNYLSTFPVYFTHKPCLPLLCKSFTLRFRPRAS